jgi:LysM repeat protein
MSRLAIFILFSLISYSIFPQSKNNRISPEDYIQLYKDIAIREMKRSGIPASITLSQGMLESDNGNSRLARNAKNHFGIKCHNDWKGKGFYQDDDKANECFRTYSIAEDSYIDHTDFLLSKQRYSFLFEYKSSDYKNWAKGLKKAGYATSPTYAGKLIEIIERYELHYFDSDLTASQRPASHYKTSRNKKDDPEFTINIKSRPIYQKNNVDFIIVKKGDTFYKISNEMELLNWELFKYNELTKDSVLREGQVLYLQPKRRRAERGSDFHTVKPGETSYTISQQYGIKLKQLLKFNHLTDTTAIHSGDVLNLRKKKKIE